MGITLQIITYTANCHWPHFFFKLYPKALDGIDKGYQLFSLNHDFGLILILCVGVMNILSGNRNYFLLVVLLNCTTQSGKLRKIHKSIIEKIENQANPHMLLREKNKLYKFQ